MRSGWVAAGLLGLGIAALTDPGSSRAETRHAKVSTAPSQARLHVLRPLPPERAPLTDAEARDAVLMSLTDDPVLGRAEVVKGLGPKNLVAFTFDDGPHPDTTPRVLTALEKYDVPAAFFIVTKHLDGARREKVREILQREVAGGFTIGSHTQSHANLEVANRASIHVEIDESVLRLANEIGHTVGMFRPPYGRVNLQARNRLTQLGLTEVRWSIDPRDWEAEDGPTLRKNVLQMIKTDGGGVVLLHDVKPITAEIIGKVFDDLEAENCRRLAAGTRPILPVSIHYFLHDADGAPRTVPPEVQARTDAYREALPGRCARRR